VLMKFEKVGVIEKKLREHEIRSRIDFLLKVRPVRMFSFFAGDMPFRKTRRANAELAFGPDEFNQLARKFKAALGFDEASRSARRIAAQGEYIADSAPARVVDHRAGLLARGIHTGKVAHG